MCNMRHTAAAGNACFPILTVLFLLVIFTPLEKAYGGVGGEYQGNDGGSSPEANPRSLSGFTTEIFAAVPRSASSVFIKGNKLLVSRRAEDGLLSSPCSYIIRGLA